MKTKTLIIAACIALLSMGAYAYVKSKLREDPEPGEKGGDAPDYAINFESDDMATVGTIETKNFKLSEFACHDGTPVPKEHYGNVAELMQNLQKVRNRIGLPIMISSGYRTPSWNAKQPGAAKNSFHMKAMAADLKVVGMTPTELKNVIELMIAEGSIKQGGVGLYPTFVHYDVRGERARW